MIELLAAILKKDKVQFNEIEYAHINLRDFKQADGIQINIGLQKYQGESQVGEKLMDWMKFLAADSREVLEILAPKGEVYREAYEQNWKL